MLKNKTVLITGASSGIGEVTACACAREGASLILVSRPPSEEALQKCAEACKAEGASDCQCFTADFTDRKQVDDLCAKCCSSSKSIDVLINNAGIFGTASEDEQGPLKGDVDQWERVLDVNVRAPMIWTKHFANALVDNKRGGTIINIGDVEGTHSGPRHPVYAASKHALRGWSLACYEKLRHHGIGVVHLAPGNVKGTHMMSETEKASGHQGAIAPEDVAEACLFALRLKDAVPVEIELKALRGEAATAMASE